MFFYCLTFYFISLFFLYISFCKNIKVTQPYDKKIKIKSFINNYLVSCRKKKYIYYNVVDRNNTRTFSLNHNIKDNNNNNIDNNNIDNNNIDNNNNFNNNIDNNNIDNNNIFNNNIFNNNIFNNNNVLPPLGNKNILHDIEKICKEANNLKDKEKKINYLIEQCSPLSKKNYFPPILKVNKAYKNKKIDEFNKGNKNFYINQVRKDIFYRYVNRCDENLFMAIDIQFDGDQQRKDDIKNKNYGDNEKYGDNKIYGDNEKYCDNEKYGDNKIYGDNEKYGDNKKYGDNEKYCDNKKYGDNEKYGDNKIYGESNNYYDPIKRDNLIEDEKNLDNFFVIYNDNIKNIEPVDKKIDAIKNLLNDKYLKEKKLIITIDAYSDNLILYCFLYIILKHINKIHLSTFLNLEIKEILVKLKEVFDLHFNVYHIINYIYEYIHTILKCYHLKIKKKEKKNMKEEDIQKNMYCKNEMLCYNNNDNDDDDDKKMIYNESSLVEKEKKNKETMKLFTYPRIAHMLSGGVDSLMALHLLEKKKFLVDNYFFNFTNADCSKNDIKYVKDICKNNKRNLFIININEEYFDQVLVPMLFFYADGKVPNPDIMCNQKIKYNFFLKVIKSIYKQKYNYGSKQKLFNYDYISTGHYAMIRTNDKNNPNNMFNNDVYITKKKGNINKCLDNINKDKVKSNYKKNKKYFYKLLVSSDKKKDQTFFLSSFNEKQLSKFIFPLSLYKKTDVKQYMKDNNINNYNSKETKGLCLFGNIDMQSLLQKYFVKTENNMFKLNNNNKKKLLIDLTAPSDLKKFKEKFMPQMNLRYINYLINLDDKTILDINSDIHLYAIGQHKNVTNYLHNLYNQKMININGHKKKHVKNVISSFQWIVVYKKIKKDISTNILHNFIYLTKNYDQDLFTHIRTKCKLNNIKWIQGKLPVCIKKQLEKKKIINNNNINNNNINNNNINNKYKTNDTYNVYNNIQQKNKKKLNNIPLDEITIFVKIRNSEQIKKAKIKFSSSNNTAYLKVKQKDNGFSPGQIITFYFPFIIKNNKVKYITNLKKYNNPINNTTTNSHTKQNTIYYHCLGSATISNQFLDYNLYQHIKNIHQENYINISI
ncbi:tRNA methyltransferase, putative [Plasmodium sp. gorilla clade G2]|uniref:tRNA methyltransferase, putative n=1 Tax=Plasmodium sp. gorilla clade G2 TaxID=880535 RepID=UPI000D22AAEA|nr:tRNA methyltransferase, putative [Plasmodium sp. gorilla clade G2]SOV14907.1 tRNA methyltransferase, putative [Plasmodium sp. gorilla clade G2]